MEWFFPSLKNALFPAKSTSAIADSVPVSSIIVNEQKTPDDIPVVEEVPALQPQQPQLRRRSSLSDLDKLLTKREHRPIRSSDLLTIGEYGQERRERRLWSLLLDQQQASESGGYPLSSGTKGGSIGDMINLKLYGSNRSLVSGTSSIAEAVPLETIQRKKTATVSTSSSRVVEFSDDVFGRSTSLALEDADINQTDVTDGHVNNIGDYDPLKDSFPDEVLIIEEEEDGQAQSSSDLSHQFRANRWNIQMRTPSIMERAERLSKLIRNRQCRCSRYAQDIAVKIIVLMGFSFSSFLVTESILRLVYPT